MGNLAGENSSADSSAEYNFAASRPWPWVSYDDPAWPLDPWILMDDEDLADAAVRLGIWYLQRSVQEMTMLRAAALYEDAVGRVVADVVAESRTRSFSWGRIAECFGVGRTAVQKRFGKHPDEARSQTLEQQYRWMSDYLYAAERDVPDAYPDRNEVVDTRARVINRRRGRFHDPLDQVPKVVTRQRRSGVRGSTSDD